jgi:hypothetical protein
VHQRAEPAEAPRFLFDLHHGPSVCAGKTGTVFRPDRGGEAMDATVRRYDGIDTTRSEEIVRKVDETLIPAPSELEGSRPTC